MILNVVTNNTKSVGIVAFNKLTCSIILTHTNLYGNNSSYIRSVIPVPKHDSTFLHILLRNLSNDLQNVGNLYFHHIDEL